MKNFFLYNYEIFYNNLGMHALIIHFCFVLIGLNNDYKNVYSHNVCILVFHTNCSYVVVCMWWFFIRIVSMQWFFIRIVSMRWFFIRIVSFKIIFSMKRGYVYVWETCKHM